MRNSRFVSDVETPMPRSPRCCGLQRVDSCMATVERGVAAQGFLGAGPLSHFDLSLAQWSRTTLRMTEFIAVIISIAVWWCGILRCTQRPWTPGSASVWLAGPKRRDVDTELLEWLGIRYSDFAALAPVAEN